MMMHMMHAKNKRKVNGLCFYRISFTVVVTLVLYCSMLFQQSVSATEILKLAGEMWRILTLMLVMTYSAQTHVVVDVNFYF